MLNIQNVVHGLMFLLLVRASMDLRQQCIAQASDIVVVQDPNPADPLNQKAAEVMRDDKHQFEQLVRRSLRGGNVQGTLFARNPTIR